MVFLLLEVIDALPLKWRNSLALHGQKGDKTFRAEEVGQETKELFMRDRFVNGSSETLFCEPITRRKLKTMEDSNKTVKTVKLTASPYDNMTRG